MARTPLFRFIQKAMSGSVILSGGAVARSALSRRQMLKLTAAAGAAAMSVSLKRGAWAAGATPLIAVIGAGVAGLTAAYRLQKAGLKPIIFEASNRVGGRMMTLRKFYRGMFCELGGELVDTNHEDLKTLAGEIGVELQPLAEGDTGEDLYYFGGTFHAAKEMLDPAAQSGAFKPIAEQIAADYAQLLDEENNWTEFAVQLDQISLKDYLRKFRGKTADWAIDLLDVAYRGEFGLETEDQSCLNLVDFITTELDQPFRIFGESDEAYRIKGGSSALIEALEAALKGGEPIRLGHALAGLESKGGRVTAAFDAPGGKRSEDFDFVILALPFTRLRQVEGLDALSLGEDKLKSIRELGYGANAKLMTGAKSRVWREEGNLFPAPSNGSLYADLPFQSVWETSRAQPGDAGVLTNYLGGKAGEGDEKTALEALRAGLSAMSPRLAESLDEAALASFFWARHPFTLGSYASAKPGQYTTLLDIAAEPALDGRLQFAGEHTSANFLGYMNGGVESGNRAAAAVLELVKG